MKFVASYKYEIVFLLSILFLYFLFRLPNLTYQPIFADEAIYIRWAQIMRSEPTLRFLPLTDGKTPLFMWAMIPMFKIFSDPLFAGRFLSVISGFITLAGCFFLGHVAFKKSVGLWAAFFVAITPMIVFFDRMALVDSMLSAFSVWALTLAILLIKYQRMDIAMFLGYIFGSALLTKPPGFLNILALPITLIMFNWRDKYRQNKLVRLFSLWFIAIIISMVIYNILRLGPGFSNLNSRNQDYIFSPLELLSRPFDPFIPHTRDLVDWFPKFITIPVLISSFAGIFLAIKNINKTALVVLGWVLIPLIAQMFLLKTFTARYILFSIPPFLVLAGLFVDYFIQMFRVHKTAGIIVLISAFLVMPAYFNFSLLFNLSSTPLPKGERRGYLEDWTAGYGLKEIAQYLDKESEKGLVVVGTEGSFGTLPDGLQIYLDQNSNVKIIGGKAIVSDMIKENAKIHPTFFVANKARYKDPDEKLQLIKEYPKIIGDDIPPDSILFYEVLP